MRSVTILGAGLVGSVLAVLLRRRGYEVTIYERRPDMRKAEIAAGRSINFALSHRGWKALELAGLREEIESISIPMPGRFLHQEDGSSAFQAYGKNGEAIYSVSRGELNKRLMTLAEQSGAKIHFNHRCTKALVPENIIRIQSETGTQELKCDLLFGADGAFSSLRTSLSFMDRTNFSQHYIEHGYKELSIPAGPNGEWLIEKNALHIWPRHNYMMIALPNLDGSFTCTLFFPFEGNPSFNSVKSREEINVFFKKQFPDAVALMPTLIEDYLNNPVSSLITTKIFPWHYKDQSCIIGDAAHAIVPFYGQGLNAGFEDCTVLDGLIEKLDNNWAEIFREYEKVRKPNADAIAELAFKNFIEMRDKVADPEFLQRKKIEKELGRRFPGQFNSVYEMISFSHAPYALAWKSMKLQDELLAKIAARGDFFENIQSAGFEEELESWLGEYNRKIQENV
jgi:kynurenine 3-monooxygenase